MNCETYGSAMQRIRTEDKHLSFINIFRVCVRSSQITISTDDVYTNEVCTANRMRARARRFLVIIIIIIF